MDDFLNFTITGLGSAAIIAIGASGLVLTYTTTGVFNFAHGAIGMLGAFMYWQLRFDWGLPAPVAFVIVLFLFAPLVGGLLERVIFRGLQGTTEAVRLVVTVSLLFATIGIANWVWKPGISRTSERFFGTDNIEIGGVVVQYQELFRIGAAVVIAVGLRILLYRTRAGIAMRATVDDRPLAALNGARPDRAAMLAWAIGCSLAMLSGILYVGGIALDAQAIALLIINAYAAAMIGRLRSLPLTFAGALLIGLGSQYWSGYAPQGADQRWAEFFGKPIVASIPIIVLFVVLLVLPAPRLRGHGIHRTREYYPMPSWRGALLFGAVVVGGAAMAIPLLTTADTITVARLFGTAIIALSLVPLVGLGGQVSLCQLSLAGIGGVTMAHLGHGGSPMGLVWAVVFSGVVGALIALPALRLSGIYLALATAAFAVFMDRWVWKLKPFGLPFSDDVTISIFGTGSVGVDRLRILGFDSGDKGELLWLFDTTAEDRQLLLLAVAFALLCLVVVAIRRGPFGRRLLAMKDSEAACATVGMNLTGTKLAVFTISAAIAGFGGALIAGIGQTTNQDNWQFAAGLPIFMLGVVGGLGRLGGALFAGISLQTLTSMSTWPVLNTRFLGMGPPAGWYAKFAAASPGFMGVGLGRNPNGAVSDMRAGFEPIMHSKRALGVFVATIGVLYVATLNLDVLNGWIFVLGTIAALGIGAQIGLREGLRAGSIEAPEDPTVEEFGGTALEWVGIDRPVTDSDVALLDEKLGVPAVVGGRGGGVA
jgi:branched-chain amino acid transport system permease protein